MRVLVVEDDRRMAGLLDQVLREDGYQVSVSHTGPDGLETALNSEFDVIVLDVMLPGFDGFEFTRRLRAKAAKTPILILTARDAAADIVRGLDLGADDYLTKPFPLDVFLARVRAAARRGPATHTVILSAGDISLDTSSHAVSVCGKHVVLTRTEYSILEMLLRRKGRVVSREAILTQIWGNREEVENNTLDAFMKLLRSKVDCDPARRFIHTLRGVGYILRSKPE